MDRHIFYIKLVHSLLLFLIVVATLYFFVSVLLDRITPLTWWGLGVVVVEFFILVFNNWRCPLTTWAEELGAESGAVAPIFLPRWLSDRLFGIFVLVFLLSCALLLWRLAG